MSSIFLRIYGGLLFSLVLVSVLSGIVVTILNSLRVADYREDMARATFRLVSDTLATMPDEQRQPWLEQWSHTLSIPFTMIPVSHDDNEAENLEQLAKGEVTVQMLTEKSAIVTSWINDQWLIQGKVPDVSEQMVSGTMILLRHLLNAYPANERAQALAKFTAFSYPVNIVTSPQLTPTQDNELRQGSIVTVLNLREESLQLYAQLTDNNQVIRLGPVKLLNLYPFKLTLTLGISVLIFLSLAIYILVRGIERRLRKLERAATRFSRGDFDVRVHVGGTDSIGRLALAFNAMADHIQRLLSLQKELIRGVSHELRTPVARLRFGLDLVADAKTVAERETQLDGMDQDIQELDNLVDEFLTYANLEQGAPTLDLKRHDVDKVVAQVVAEHLRQQNRVTIEHIPCNVLNPRRFIEIDRRYLHRAIQNLVGNACRYADSQIQVRFTSTQDTCRIDVDDDGPGIAKEQWERVFSAFSRLDDSRTRKSGGYGLGLSIVRRIMYWHDGRALVSDSPLGGARFSLVWPRKQRH